MPTYSYACTACDHRFDVQQSFSDASLSDCPRCEGRLRKLFGNVGVVFKGPGFYRTDARAGATNGGRTNAARSNGSGAGSGASSATSGTGTSGQAGSTGSGGAGASTGSTTSGSGASSGSSANRAAASA